MRSGCGKDSDEGKKVCLGFCGKLGKQRHKLTQPAIDRTRDTILGLREKIPDRNVENVRDFVKAARGDAVAPFLVFLNLLEADTDSARKLLLGPLSFGPDLDQALSDQFVDLIR